ncbi:P-loop NTPase fold protein [Xanthobacter sp. 126]|uniref:KAP family P-loop NTPase fold protein n=1 Tax=Xanthobacter sp. 126 TaxID=1131814 RepID=UPI0009E015F5|nr:P-loop NTPase fold protein [Xanthobacter sp. 126]
MKIIPPTLTFAENEGFTSEKDLFQRASFGKGLTNIVSQSEDPLVILLDSPWGTGKTTFLQMWAGELRKSGRSVIYFDAFANDYIENAFLAVAGEIIELANNKKDANKSKIKKFVEKASKAGSVLIRGAAKIGVKAATLGAIDAADINEQINSISNDIATATSNGVDAQIKRILERQADEKITLKAFREALSELPSLISEGHNTPEGNQNECEYIVFIIDELDRCKPTFALDIIESVKHIFSVKNIHFVISATISQMQASVKYAYGSDIDALRYLDKFYTFAISFPNTKSHPSAAKKYLSYVSKSLGRDPIRDREIDNYIDIIEQVSNVRDFSFRTLERIIYTVNICLAMTPKDRLKLNSIICGLCIMRVSDPDIFQRAKNGSLTLAEVDLVFGFKKWPKNAAASAEWVRSFWVYCLEEELPPDNDGTWKAIQNTLFHYSSERLTLIPWTAGAVVEQLHLPQ